MNWHQSALHQELTTLATLPDNAQRKSRICKPGSLFSVTLLKIASIAKGATMPEYETLTAVKRACAAYGWLKPKELDRQFSRAWAKAEPRQPDQLVANPLPPTRIAGFIVTCDLFGNALSKRPYTIKTAVKARELAAMLSDYLETGVKPENGRFDLFLVNEQPNGKNILNLAFRKRTQSLIDCLTIALQLLGGSILNDYGSGHFDVIVPADGRLGNTVFFAYRL